MGKFFFSSSKCCRFTNRSVLVLTPLAVQYLTNKGFFKRRPWANTPIQLGLVGAILIFATPLGCALFSQTASISVSLSIEKLVATLAHVHNNFFRLGIITRTGDSGEGQSKKSEFTNGLLQQGTIKDLIEIGVVDVKLRILHLEIDF